MHRLVLALALLSSLAARADGVPEEAGHALPAAPAAACGPAREGEAACLAGQLCLCRFERGGSLVGRPDRFAWDCGVLRPSCGKEPAGAGPVLPMPEVFPQLGLPGPGYGQGYGAGPATGFGPEGGAGRSPRPWR